MRAPYPRFIITLILTACTDRPLGDTETDTTHPSTSDAPPGTTASPGTTGPGPGTTASPGTTAVPTTSEPTTAAPTTVEPTTDAPPLPTTATTTSGDDSAGTTVEPGTTIEPGTTGVKFDMFVPDGPGLHGCVLDAPPGTMVSGTSELGPFAAQRAYFGWIGFSGDPFQPLILFVSPEADPAVEVELTNGSTGAILHGFVGTDPFDEGGWIGTWGTSLEIFDKGQLVSATRPDAVVIEALAGNWDEFDPADPPRLLGKLQGAIAGPFDAVFCDELIDEVIPE
ncbi:hypothetical protein [Nannocystis radixulma]|uniref:Uncharacterized protein n=1 Tax=Nannocystis radixulma TaxID=2995305 RepID=A0ABT5AYR1_9BACT|nr:hypothetical protein [Nannocystis radixulma]MDC0666984.1 hypothetical protein [Nannocystis radixulma]